MKHTMLTLLDLLLQASGGADRYVSSQLSDIIAVQDELKAAVANMSRELEVRRMLMPGL